MLMHPAPLAVMDYVGPALGALLFVAVMSLVAEPTRRTLNAIIIAGASGVYLSGGFGLWELAYPVIGAAIGFRALRSYRWIGVGWLIHAGWDIAHHMWGNPIWPFMPSSAFGCMIFDSMIAPWFLAGAPSFLKRLHAAMSENLTGSADWWWPSGSRHGCVAPHFGRQAGPNRRK
jgi:Family of unknown function (DUF6010)